MSLVLAGSDVDIFAGDPGRTLARGRKPWPPPQRSTGRPSLSDKIPTMPHRTGSYFHLHLVSDATGETLLTVARAAAAQFASVEPVEHMHPLVRTQKQLDRVLEELDDAPGIVLYTLLERELANRLEEKCRTLGLPCLSIMGPVLQLFHSYLGGETKPRVGAQHALDADYFKRIDALNFTMMHDDGQQPHKTELFADHREQEVGVRLGQPVQFFNTAAQTHTKNFTATDGDERMRELIALTQRMGRAPWIEVGKDALASPIG